jgi:hypothetical protein
VDDGMLTMYRFYQIPTTASWMWQRMKEIVKIHHYYMLHSLIINHCLDIPKIKCGLKFDHNRPAPENELEDKSKLK